MEAESAKSNIFDKISNDFGRGWKQLGRSLSVPDSRLDEIDANPGNLSLYEKTYQTLSAWWNKSTGSTRNKLKELKPTLKRLDRNDLADEIKI